MTVFNRKTRCGKKVPEVEGGVSESPDGRMPL